jgi:hypothetical protein
MSAIVNPCLPPPAAVVATPTVATSYSWAYLVAAIASIVIIIIAIYNIWQFNKIRTFNGGVVPIPLSVSDGTTGVIVNVILLILGIFILIASLYFLFAGGTRSYVVQTHAPAVAAGPIIPPGTGGSYYSQRTEAAQATAAPPVVVQQPAQVYAYQMPGPTVVQRPVGIPVQTTAVGPGIPALTNYPTQPVIAPGEATYTYV